MPISPVRFSQLRWLYNITCVTAMVGAGVVMLLGLAGKGSSPDLWLILAGAFLLFVAIMMMTVLPLLIKMEATFARQLHDLRQLNDIMAKQKDVLEVIAGNTQLSDAAKSLAHREQEFEALHAAIRETIQQERWEAAGNLADEIEQRFGFKREADDLREEIDEARRDVIDEKLTAAIQLIETHFKDHDWARAQNEIDRLAHALPGDAKVISMQDRLKVLKEQQKKDLKAAWNEAVRRSDTDHAIEVLRELDQYLSPAEAHALQASARDVFKDKLLQFGVQFRFAVNEKRWQDALSIGLELVRDFPNSRMAGEVREAVETLRERAGETAQTEPARTPGS